MRRGERWEVGKVRREREEEMPRQNELEEEGSQLRKHFEWEEGEECTLRWQLEGVQEQEEVVVELESLLLLHSKDSLHLDLLQSLRQSLQTHSCRK